MRPDATLPLSRRDVLALLTRPECSDAVERAFRLHAEGRTLPRGVLGVQAPRAASTSRRRGSWASRAPSPRGLEVRVDD